MAELDYDELQRLADAATPGPWSAWLDQDGQPHLSGMLMVGNAAAVIPEGETWIEGVDVNPIAHTYTPEDREFIAASRSAVPVLLDRVRELEDFNGRLKDAVAAYRDLGISVEAERDAALSTIAKVEAWVDANREFLPRPMAWEIERALGSVPSTGEGNE